MSQVRVQTVSPIDSVGSEIAPGRAAKPPETRLNCGMVTSVEIANFLGDRVLELKIKQDLDITGYAAANPGRAGAISFVSSRTSDALELIDSSRSSLLLVNDALRIASTESNCIIVADARMEFARVAAEFFGSKITPGVHPSAIVEAGANVAADAFVGANAYIGRGVVVGARSWIGPNAVLLEGTRIGSDSSVGPGTVIGHVGFGYSRDTDGSPIAIPHSGGVVIGDNVDIGANTCIDRGTMSDTVIEDQVKIDNLVHIAHNCVIGEAAYVIATAIVGGSVKVGPRAWIAPNASIRQKVQIGADAIVGLGACVVRDVREESTVMGNPAKERE